MMAGIAALLVGLAAVITAAGSWRSAKRTKDAVGVPNGNGPANQALHVVIEMQKEQSKKLDALLEREAELATRLDDHMKDRAAHSGVRLWQAS